MSSGQKIQSQARVHVGKLLASLARRIATRYLGENLKPKKRGERERGPMAGGER